MWWDANEGMGWWMLFGMIWMVIFGGGIIGLIVWGVSQVTSGSSRKETSPRGEDEPLEIAKRRYARGEITREEFEQLRQDVS